MKIKITLVLFFFSFQIVFSQDFNFTETVIAQHNNWAKPKFFDMDSDGVKDIVSISSSGYVSWWKDLGNDEYEKHNITTGYYLGRNFDVADTDGDGDLDVITGTDTTLDLWINDGNQNFTHSYINGWQLTSSINVGDFDNDGNIDFITSQSHAGGTITLWKNFGLGLNVFQRVDMDNIQNLNLFTNNSIEIADINQDGYLDIAIANPYTTNDKLFWLENDGSANFTKNVIPYPYICESIHTLDYDGDSDIDILFKRGECCIMFAENDGNNNFSITELVDVPVMVDMTIGDFNEDGHYDFIALYGAGDLSAPYVDEIRLFENDGTNNFNSQFITSYNHGTNTVPFDINNDGHIDFLTTASLDDDISVFKNDGTAQFNRTDLEDQLIFPSNLEIVDINNDGFKEITASISHESELIIWKNIGGIGFDKILPPIDSDNKLGRINVVDFDNDGDIDIVAGREIDDVTHDILFYKNTGSGFEKTILFSGSRIHSVIIGDLDNDSDLDIVYSILWDSSGSVNWLENDGNQNFTQHTIESGLNSPKLTSIMDINNNGYLDIKTSKTKWYLNNGNGSFSIEYLPVNGFLSDLDKDGDLDIISTMEDYLPNQKLAWSENDGNLNFTEHIIDNNYKGGKVGVQDFDADGDMDIITGDYNDYNSDGLVAWKNDGNMSFTKSILGGGHLGISQVIINDIDADGDMDIITSNFEQPITVWFNDSNIPLDIELIYPKQDDVYIEGENIRLQFLRNIAIPTSNTIDLFYSIDNGITWVSDGDFTLDDDSGYNWITPNVTIPTEFLVKVETTIGSNSYLKISSQFIIQPLNFYQSDGFVNDGVSQLKFLFQGLTDTSIGWYTRGSTLHNCLDDNAQDWYYLSVHNCGKDIRAPFYGKVIYINIDSQTNVCGDNPNPSSYGTQLVIQSLDDKTMAIRIAHLKDINLNLSVGDIVNYDDIISKVGGSGTEDIHAHCSFYKNIYGWVPLIDSDGNEVTRTIIERLKVGGSMNDPDLVDLCQQVTPFSAEYEFINTNNVSITDNIIPTQEELVSFVSNLFNSINLNLFTGTITSGRNSRNVSSNTVNSLDGLESLLSIDGNLTISYTDILNLDGLQNLTHVGGDVIIENNSLLTNFCGLYALIENGGIGGSLIINGNSINPTSDDILNNLGCESSLSIEDILINQTNIIIYPNPAEEFFNIKNDINVDLVEIFDLSGKLLFSHKNTLKISLKNYLTGVYIIKIYTKNKLYIQKLIKK